MACKRLGPMCGQLRCRASASDFNSCDIQRTRDRCARYFSESLPAVAQLPLGDRRRASRPARTSPANADRVLIGTTCEQRFKARVVGEMQDHQWHSHSIPPPAAASSACSHRALKSSTVAACSPARPLAPATARELGLTVIHSVIDEVAPSVRKAARSRRASTAYGTRASPGRATDNGDTVSASSEVAEQPVLPMPAFTADQHRQASRVPTALELRATRRSRPDQPRRAQHCSRPPRSLPKAGSSSPLD